MVAQKLARFSMVSSLVILLPSVLGAQSATTGAIAGVFHVWCRENPVAALAWVRGLPGVDEEFREMLRPVF